MLAGPCGKLWSSVKTSSIWTCSWTCHHLAPWLWERAIEFDCVGTEKVITLGVLAMSKGMVSGYLGSLTTEEDPIALGRRTTSKKQMGSTRRCQQAGISAAVYVQRKHVPRTLKRLEKTTTSIHHSDTCQVQSKDDVFTNLEMVEKRLHY